MARKKSRGNGTGTVAPRRNNHGKVIGYRGAYFGPDGKRRWVSAKTKTEAIDAALNLVVFRKEILRSLEKVAGKGGTEKVF